ncbi:unnamed protein product [Menidia menidia]|uniref:chitinase n=1 Tax=Menidia menidia TaxID=238744 RepID=A0A8S4B2C4_9TELE|nr:unnamed protein product [Menidia menidia]
MNTSQELKSFSLNSGKDWEKEEEDRITLYDAMYGEKRENIVLQRLVVVARLPPDSADGTQLGAHWEDLTFQLGRAHRWDQITGLLLVYPACLLHVIESSREILIAVLKDLQLMQQQPERAVLEAKIVFMGLNLHSRMFQQWSYKVLNKNQVIGNEAMTGHEEEESTESLVCSVLAALQSLTQKLDLSKTDYAMKYWRDNGTPVEKLRMGFASYGRTFRLASSATGVGAPASGAASAGPYTREAGFWSYYEICTFLKGTTIQWIDDQKVPYATKNSEWVGFDTKESYDIKVQYMKDMKFGGAFVWALDLDDFNGEFCGEGSHPLLSHLRRLVDGGMPTIPTTTTKPGPSTTKPGDSTTKPGPSTTKPGPSTTKPGPSTTKPGPSTTTAAPVPGPDFCKDKPDGLFENREDQSSFFQCASGRTFLRNCAAGTVFEESCKCCGWP